jgi:hypothetical protein
MNSLAYADVSTDDLSSATSLVSAMQQVSQSFGVAVGALLLRYYSTAHLSILTPTVFHETFYAMGILTFISTFIFLGLQTKDGYQMLRGPAQEKVAIQHE